MASIGWIDFSPTHRSRVGSVLDLLRPEGMVDELGLGTIRDALANQLFPGFSTIQTRAKYFFIVPYILYDYQALKPAQRKGKSPSQFLKEKEYEIMWDLGDKYRALAKDMKTRESFGVIGITKERRGKDFIVRRPSAIYWNGLYTYQFIDTHGLAADSFLRQAVNPSMETLISAVQTGDDNTDDADAEHENIFKLKVSPKLNWSESLTLDLEKNEAGFFADRIISKAKNKIIAELLISDELWGLFIKAENFMHFAKATLKLPLADNLKAMLTLSHDFSELMYGAHIAYNCGLHHKVFNSDYWDEVWEVWLQDLQSNMLNFENFNPEDLFVYALTTRKSTVQFVKDWWKLCSGKINDVKKRDHLIQQQEGIVKGSKARLRWNKTDDVKEEKWLGLRHFDYRFNQARIILKDIKTGLQN